MKSRGGTACRDGGIVFHASREATNFSSSWLISERIFNSTPQSASLTAPLTQGSLSLWRELCKAKAFWNHQHCWWFSFQKKIFLYKIRDLWYTVLVIIGIVKQQIPCFRRIIMKNIKKAIFFVVLISITLAAFAFCSCGQKIDPKNSVKEGESEGLEYKTDKKTCTVIGIGECTDTELVIPEFFEGRRVVAIKDHAFADKSSLTSVSIPDCITEIGDHAFDGCLSLKNVKLPAGLAKIESGLFGDCKSLKQIEIPDGTVIIDALAFSGCSSLESITLPDSIEVIDWGVFKDCKSLKTITVPPKVREIRSSTFSGCLSLTDVTLPHNISTISDHAFSRCESLEHIELPVRLITLKDGAFASCISLKSIHLPSQIENMGTQVFYSCSSLESISADEGLTSIGTQAFFCCFGLTKAELPSSLTHIGANAFSTCTDLVEITFAGTVDEWNAIEKTNWNGDEKKCKIVCSDGTT